MARRDGTRRRGGISELGMCGTVKRGPQVLAFAREHGLKIISVADLIAYRQLRERLVEQTARFAVETKIGTAQGFSYVTPFDAVEQLALVYGDISGGKNIPVRLHREKCWKTCSEPQYAGRSVRDFKREGKGVLVYLQEVTAGVRRPAVSGWKDRPDAEARARLAGHRFRARKYRATSMCVRSAAFRATGISVALQALHRDAETMKLEH